VGLSLARGRYRALAYGAGTAVFAAALFYLFAFAADHWAELRQSDLRGLEGGWLAAAVAAYSASVVTTSLAWPAILKSLGRPLPLSIALPVSLAAQSGKYLPGNVAHYVGRAALAARNSVPVRMSAASTAVEFASAMAAALITCLAMAAVDPRFLAPLDLGWSDGIWRLGIVAAAVSLLLIFIVAARQSSFLSRLMRWGLWIRPVAFLLLSFALAGFSFFAVSEAIGTGGLTAEAAIAIFAAAWAVGFAVPGAPAGLGVREAVIILLASPFLTPTGAMLCALLHRLMSAVVDGAMALLGAALLVRKGAPHGA
jgi:hypothetical protein